jgi:hypothetical protein
MSHGQLGANQTPQVCVLSHIRRNWRAWSGALIEVIFQSQQEQAR